MTRQIFLIFVLTISLCSCSDNQSVSTPLTTSADTNRTTNDEVSSEINEECVFDTSTYKFTTEALHKYSPEINYRWDTTIKSARVRLNNGDSLTLNIGGCNFFGFRATLLTFVEFSDTTKLFSKTKWLAKTFFYQGFEKKIPDLITKGHIKLSAIDNGENSKVYTFADPDTAKPNLNLAGFAFGKEGNMTRIEIAAYIDRR